MTSIVDVQDRAPRAQYTALAAQTVFPYPFPIFEDSDLVVYDNDTLQVLTTDYTVSGAGDDTGGNVTFTSGRTVGHTITIYRDIAIERNSDFATNGPFASASMNDELDRITLVMQQLESEIKRCLRLAKTASVSDSVLELSPLANWLNKYVYIGASGIPEPATSVETTTLSQSVIGALLYPQTAQESVAGVTPTNYGYPYLDIRRYGGVGDGVTNCTSALQQAILASRSTTGETRLDTIGGSNIVMYRSGVITFPAGTFVLSYDTFNLTQEMGITLRGQGSRRFTNAIKAATTLLFTGTSAGYGFKLYRNGSRSCHFEDLDICYDSDTFTGHLVDMIDSPGLKFRRCFLGTSGITAPTRFQTAASLLRLTYLEDVTLEDCTLDGAIDGIWVDDARTELGNTFGGWGLTLARVTFYDFTGDMVRHDGLRTLANVKIHAYFNPINIDCVRALDLNNVDGLMLEGTLFAPSTAAKAGTEWLRLVGVTGVVRGNTFGDLAEAGTLNGTLDVVGNVVFCTDGFTLTGGTITGKNNEFGQAVDGWIIAPPEDICVDLGPDIFKAGVSRNSYRIAADSAFLAGRINYNSALDGSASKFTNASARISILNVDAKWMTDTSAALTMSILDTGRTYVASGGAGQVYTLPAPIEGCELSVAKESTQTLQVTAGSAILRTGSGGVKTSVSATNAADVGVYWKFKARAGVWYLIIIVGASTYA